jgi:hypothetical protein
MRSSRRGVARWWAILATALLLTLMSVACVQVKRAGQEPAEPRSYAEVTALIDTLRVFEARIGFRETKNFRRLTEERPSFPFCGNAPRLYLPYSYEDPAIKWYDVSSEEQCRSIEEGADVYFGHSEALGEIDSPVTPAMLAAPLPRLMYVVLHEDCHDQFDLPYGIEEALCNVIVYHALPTFAVEQYGRLRAEYYATDRYASAASADARTTIRFYDEVAALYARHAKLATPSEQIVLNKRNRIFRRAGRALGWGDDGVNNVMLANAMTYSRHYPFIEDVFASLAHDVGRTVAFFRDVEQARPTPDEVMRRHALSSKEGVDYLRAYESSVVETARKLLAQRGQAFEAP